MAKKHNVELRPAKGKELAAIENLMQFYLYDFSEFLPLQISENGLFTIRSKASYWEKSTTLPFLIWVDGEIAGFVTVDDETHFPSSQYSIGYFFVSRRFRGHGIGATVVAKLLNQLPGEWQIFYVTSNSTAASFWAKTISRLTNAAFTVDPVIEDEYECTLYRFTWRGN
ncbi:MAG: GNAT family N-acetyltransferase [Rhodoferax sp.]